MPRSDLLARALDAPADPPLRPLPGAVAALLRELAAPPRLAAHLRLVREVACQLADWCVEFHPALTFDREAVLFGAATHGIGKAVHTAELAGPGSAHEPVGRELLLAHGFTPARARFAATHATWSAPGVSIEELLVNAADKVWKGKRVAELEDLLIDRLVRASPPGTERWEAFLGLDALFTGIAEGADARPAFQAAHPIAA